MLLTESLEAVTKSILGDKKDFHAEGYTCDEA